LKKTTIDHCYIIREYDVINSTGQALSDVSKDKVAARQVESNTTQFTKALESVETGLVKQINYLTTVSTGCLAVIHTVVTFILLYFYSHNNKVILELDGR